MILHRDGCVRGLWKALENHDDGEQHRFWNLLENAGPKDAVSLRRAREREIADHKQAAFTGMRLHQKYLREKYGVHLSVDEIIKGLATVKLED